MSMSLPLSVAVLPCAATEHTHNIFMVLSFMVVLMCMVCGVVGISMYLAMSEPFYRPHRLESSFLEVLWTRVPTFMVFLMAVPSTIVLMEGKGSRWPLVSVFVIGHQWYWEYEVNVPVLHDGVSEGAGSESHGVDSYGVTEPEGGEARLVSTDAHLLVPAKVPVRFIITSADVIHNFNVKSLGLSVDGVPGRLAGEVLSCDVTGIFSGWCSENCGAGHFSMPCSVEVIPFSHWIDFFSEGGSEES